MQYLELIIKGLVDYPDDIQIHESTDDMGVLLHVHANPMDIGKIIGQQGGTVTAIRVIMNCYGYRNRQKISVKVIQPEDRQY